MVDPASKTHENWLAWNSEVGKGEKFTDFLLEHLQENRYFPGDGWSAKYGDVVALKRPSGNLTVCEVECHYFQKRSFIELFMDHGFQMTQMTTLSIFVG